jgi:ABC-2 type transport system permease protein
MAALLYWLSFALPLTYAYDGLARTTSPAPLGSHFAWDVVAVIGFTLASLALGAATLKRRTA